MLGDEGFKAAGEIAKTTAKAIDATEKASGYLAVTFRDAIGAIAGSAADSAVGFKIRNRASVAVKTLEHLRKLGLDASFISIEERAAFPLIEALSVESDEGLQDLWAAYISNSVDPKSSAIGVTAIITQTISKLEPEDKGVLDRLFGLDLAEPIHESIKLSSSDFNTTEESLNFSLSRFVALGLFSCDNSGSFGWAPHQGHRMPCNLEIHTGVGLFRALPLLLMFKQSVVASD
ncbi:MAG: hypothetical protein KKB37_17290 [Alphaproteobacteria bacterium]|nr:hypothetical protein [Alphaproteobacteria bacterium]